MKVIVLAGGYGTRISEYTGVIPKPMISVGSKPIICHIMEHYARYGYDDFVVALGYKAEVIKEYFLNYRSLNSDFTVNLADGHVEPHQEPSVSWKVTLVNTGLDSMTGGRIKRLREFVGDESFMVTYGDGVANINIDALVKFHKSHGKLATVSAVRPAGRFGEIDLDEDKVMSFREKPRLHSGWINGGFFVFEPEFLDLIDGDGTMLEREPLEEAARLGELMAFKHEGFWHCMDTKRDHELLESLWTSDAPWIVPVS